MFVTIGLRKYYKIINLGSIPNKYGRSNGPHLRLSHRCLYLDRKCLCKCVPAPEGLNYAI